MRFDPMPAYVFDMKLKLRDGKEWGDAQSREVLDFLSKVPLFSGLGNKELRALAAETREISCPAGKVIMKEGEPSMEFHLILNGSVEVKKRNRTIAKLGRGEFFGEMGLVGDEPRNADVIAVEPTRCLAMVSWTWRTYLRSNPSIAFEVVRVLADRLRETEKALAE